MIYSHHFANTKRCQADECREHKQTNSVCPAVFIYYNKYTTCFYKRQTFCCNSSFLYEAEIFANFMKIKPPTTSSQPFLLTLSMHYLFFNPKEPNNTNYRFKFTNSCNISSATVIILEQA